MTADAVDGKKQAGKDVPKMCRRTNQRFLKEMPNQSAVP